MTINVTEKENGVFVIAPEGNLDYITSAELDEVVTQVAEKADKMILDLEKINYIASSGLRVILNADDLMGEAHGLTLINVNDYILDIFKVTGFLEALVIE